MSEFTGIGHSAGYAPGEPNVIEVTDPAPLPLSIGQVLDLEGTYTQSDTPIERLSVDRSNDGGNNWVIEVVVNHVVTPGPGKQAFSIPLPGGVQGPASDLVIYKVYDSDNPSTYGITGILDISSFIIATTWDITGMDITDLEPLGGEILTISGNFIVGTYHFYIGEEGDEDDEPCYSGIVGQGNDVIARGVVSSLQCIAPKLNPGTGYKISAVRDLSEIFTLTSPVFTVHESTFGNKKHDIKTFFPPLYGLGIRSLDREP